ncbi:alanine racemase [Moraxella macacae 0408225]|uniref:Alanine racemase n=1 Tax=Moraxella macacae 0408225 TaxID=1230338 RepID=L2F7H2_9GAMM|nr:alanine racemase [Moraxella macacae]ELA08711.1 alanine racemase [Moraxella macacae 0408225]
MRNTHITIDLSALAHNLQIAKQHAPHAKLMAMVKANAYGHGVNECLPTLQSADALGVACLAEAKTLQQAGWDKPIIVIEGAFSLEEWQYCLANQLQCMIHHTEQLSWALQYPSKEPSNTPIWLKLNTGMNRLGFSEHEILQITKQLSAIGYPLILTSHFANADVKNHPQNKQQISIFERVLSTLKQQVSPTVQGSLCNSAGIVNFAEHQHDWVRAGIMLYGATPISEQTAEQLNLRPVMQFKASIMAIHTLDTGDCVGYGSRWQAKQPCQIGIVSVGYADGYPRVISDDAYVVAKISDKIEHLSIIGRVAMDMLMVEIPANSNVTLHTPVQLWGDKLPIDHVANWNATVSYELLCLVTKRPTWCYTVD